MKKVLFAIIGVLLLNFGMIALPTYAAVGTEACEELGGEYPDLCGGGGEEDLQNTVGSVLNVVYGLVGILAVVFIIIGGFKYSTSQGEPGKVQQAKNTIMYALIGLVVTLSAFAITQFALSAMGGN